MEFDKYPTNLVKMQLSDVDEYLFDINQIELASTGFFRALGSNLFFNEACQCLKNSIKLFQQGYFDCAFYQMRQSLEISIGTLYLTSHPVEMERWKSLEKGFENGRMLKWLIANEDTFAKMKEQLTSFFDRIRKDQLIMNKYVHKQGYQSFYLKMRNDTELSEWKNMIQTDYERILCDCIGAVAMYRLSLDAFPIALADEDLALRAPDLITEAFSSDFISKYIGDDVVEKYKQLQIYKDVVSWLSSQPKQNESVYLLIHYQCVDRKMKQEYFDQWNVLSLYDQIAVKLFLLNLKLSYVYIDGCFQYLSEVQSKNSGFTCGNGFFEEKFKESISDFNLPYNKAYLSRVKIGFHNIYLEHNELLEENETQTLVNYGNEISLKYKEIFDMDRAILQENLKF